MGGLPEQHMPSKLAAHRRHSDWCNSIDQSAWIWNAVNVRIKAKIGTNYYQVHN
jgi:hypothetical protein